MSARLTDDEVAGSPGCGWQHTWRRPALWLLALCCIFALQGCAASAAYREGQSLLAEGKTHQGLVRLEEALKLEPRNVEYRIALMSTRAQAVRAALSVADAKIAEGQVSEAERAYQQVLELEPSNPLALHGLRVVKSTERHQRLIASAEALLSRGDAAGVAEAQELLRSVVAENSAHRGAAALLHRASIAQRDLVRSSGRLALAYRKPINLEFRDAPIRSIFDLISQVSGLKFHFDAEVRQDLRATVFSKGRSIEDAIRTILMSTQLEQQVVAPDTILIFPATAQKLKDYQTLVVRTFYVSNADVKTVASTLKTIAKVRDLSIDERLNVIIIRDAPEVVRVAEKIVSLLDIGDAEVMLEVEILEVKRSRLLELGIQWPGQVTLSPIPSGRVLTLADLRNLSSSTIQAGFDAFPSINARKADQDGTTLANPRIRVRNREKAKILIGDRVPVISNTSTATGFVAESINYLDVGLKLEVEPTVFVEDVGIKINLEVSTLVKEILSKTGSLSYQIGTRGASTVLRLRNGETQILAGLISDEERATASKVPAAGELPILGRLFGSQKDDSQRNEILLSITPRIMRALPQPDFSALEFESGTEARVGAPPGLPELVVSPK
ncbi:secretin N-terminal domain-containing protein [Piscinibacter sp. HJYY11]|uniref:secretin N-terminal domain-containing protein n=1 Tax=Piscinibacter sp. HJYY11 TaxID=2801333 RepID=UPI00191FD323|nr:secretin N-terminal domain-containing protein [Piscinibacter sp. HJYY11]MBL0729598.1 general secretion pathway protein GspD [Piscinibacter sp. HJYY11]